MKLKFHTKIIVLRKRKIWQAHSIRNILQIINEADQNKDEFA